METNAFKLAQRFVGEIHELAGTKDDPFIQWCLESCGLPGDSHDEIPWCSAFANRIAWLLRLPRSKSARARSWLTVGEPIGMIDAAPEYDIVVIKRGTGIQPGPEILDAQGHVGFYAGKEAGELLILGGNQGDGVSIARFPLGNLLGIRRLA